MTCELLMLWSPDGYWCLFIAISVYEPCHTKIFIKALRLLDSYDAKIAKICNFWTFWPVIPARSTPLHFELGSSPQDSQPWGDGSACHLPVVLWHDNDRPVYAGFSSTWLIWKNLHPSSIIKWIDGLLFMETSLINSHLQVWVHAELLWLS